VNPVRGGLFGQNLIKVMGRTRRGRCIEYIAVDAANGFLLIPRCSMELTLYSRKWCSWCIDAKDYLKDKGYCFQEIDVGKDRQAYEEMRQLSSQTYVPTFVAGDKVLANFDTNQLEKFLTEHDINPQGTSS
jgi:glutaredoxin